MAMSWRCSRPWLEAEVHAWITDQPIDPGQVLAAVGSDADGAVVLFLGTVRDHNEGQTVRGVRYEAYPAMAADVLRLIVQAAAGRAGTERIAAVHRVGELGIGAVSIAVAVSSPHRAEAFAAATFIIDEVKRRLPVWKQERYASGSPVWLPGSTPPPAASP
jgi:molybdopterin synthase catalytic subunit